jgi:putative lipoprotein
MRARLFFPFAIMIATTTLSPRARAQDPDPWFGRDKALHFGASAIIAGGGYGLAATQFEARYPRLLIGGGLALAAGAGKELLDMTGFGDPSWRDFTWDVIGTATGLLVAWGIDLLVRGASAQHPLFADPAR